MTLPPCTIWQVHDHKPGHMNQMRGLAAALSERVATEVHEIPAPSRWASWRALATRTFPPGRRLPPPDLILGAGHATHAATLAARRAYGGRAVVMMKPTLPVGLFDLCLVPEHDRVVDAPNVVRTCGVLNPIRPGESHDSKQGLLLIGGPSGSYGWNDAELNSQIQSIAAASPRVAWQLTTSRRTPPSFLAELSRHELSNLAIVPHSQSPPGWVADQLAKAGQTWVTADSVSMVYEALTSGSAVGVLAVPCLRPGRVATGLAALVDRGWATRYSDWLQVRRLTAPPVQLCEAERCARIVAERLLLGQAA